MKKIFILFFLIAGLISQTKLNAQASFAELENNKIMYPSPTAAGLGKYGEYPVSLYNGLVNIGQDIVTVKSGHLELNVSLSYHASGNRPSDIPGWVGLGFSLNAGGVITRTIKDLPDDLAGGFYADNTSGQNWWNNYPNSEFIERYFSGTLDPRSDVYQFNFCGKTGEFVFDWDRHIHFKQQVPFKVQELYGPGGFAGFKVTTDDGTIYTFDQAEHSNMNFSTSDHPASSWYLTKIENLSGDIIELKYTAPLSKFRYKQFSTRKEVYGSISGAGLVTGPTVNLNGSTDEVIYLDEIDFNNGKLLFGKSTRTDPYFVPAEINLSTAEEKKLDLITLLDNSNNVVKKWKFEYFENSTERLKLKNLIVQGSDLVDIQKYSFEYNSLPLPLPIVGPNPLHSYNPYLSNDVDYWGYYNGATNGENRIPKVYVSDYNQWYGSANREINPAFVQAEMLEKITYPTGGYTKFEFESNDYSSQGDSYAASQNPMIYQEDLTESYQFRYDRDDGGFDTDPATLVFTLTEPTHVYIRYSCGADGPAHGWANPGVNYENDYQMAAGVYTVQGLLNTTEITAPTSADITRAQAFVTVYKKGAVMPLNAKIGPGLRIKSIVTNDGITNRTRHFEYKLGNVQNSTVSSGFLSAFPAFYVQLMSFANNMSGTYIASDPINDIGEGSPVGYSRVVERFEDNSYIVHNYTSYEDYPDETMPFLNGYSNPKLAHMSSNEFHRGLETNTTYYSANEIKQKEIINTYEILPGSLTDVQSIELKPTVGIQEYLNSPINYINGTESSLYYVHSCFLYNSTRTETTFDKNGQNPITTSVNKYYDNVKHLQPTRVETTGSDGSLLTTVTSFPDDYAAGTPFVDYMQTNHLTSFPIEQVVYKQKGGVNNIVSGNIITYKAEGAGLPDQLLKLEIASPLSQTTFKFSNRLTGVLPPSSQPSQYNADTHYQPLLTYTQYDNKGNLLESISRNGIKTSYLWGYKQEFPIAQIVGTDYTTASGKIINPSILVSPPSDEDLRTELNNLRTIAGAFATTYTYQPLIGVTSQTDPNGRTTYYEYDPFKRLSVIRDKDHNILKKICYNYAGQTASCPLGLGNVEKTGTFTRNNCGSGYTASQVTYTVPANTYFAPTQAEADAFAQNEVDVNGQAYANQNGTCSIIYYNSSRSGTFTRNNCGTGGTGSTVTYTVAAGTYSSTISQGDANQKADNDIYVNGQNYANQNGTCLITYYNAAKSGTFTRNNCGSGYTGSQVTYTVPANTYSSTISQVDADQKAQNDVNTNGQNYADQNGTCIPLDVSVYGENNSGTTITIQLHENASGQDYWFTIDPHGADILGDVPPGNYDITITPGGSGGWFTYAVGCGYWSDGPSAATFYGVDISSSCNSIIVD